MMLYYDYRPHIVIREGKMAQYLRINGELRVMGQAVDPKVLGQGDIVCCPDGEVRQLQEKGIEVTVCRQPIRRQVKALPR